MRFFARLYVLLFAHDGVMGSKRRYNGVIKRGDGC